MVEHLPGVYKALGSIPSTMGVWNTYCELDDFLSMCLIPDRDDDGQGTYAGLVSDIFTTCLLVLVQFVLTTVLKGGGSY